MAILATRRSRMGRLLLAGLTLAALALLGAPPAAAADPGQMNSLDLRVTPAAQGIGGPIEAVLDVEFSTDPHATLAVTNLTATLTLTGGLELMEGTTDNPVHVDRIDLPPTQGSLVVTYRWNLTATALGAQEVSVSVTTDSSGGGADAEPVTVREGIVIGQVTIDPGQPTVADTMRFEVPVTSGFDEATSPLEVWLFIYWTPAPVKPSSANGTALTLTNGQTVAGAGFPMVGDNGSYSYQVPAQPRGTLIYWVEAKTPHSFATTRADRVLVEDPAVSGAVSAGTLVAVIALAAVGAGYIAWDPPSRKPVAHGSIHNSPDRVRLALVVLLAGVAILAYAAMLGAFGDFWHRLGYA